MNAPIRPTAHIKNMDSCVRTCAPLSEKIVQGNGYTFSESNFAIFTFSLLNGDQLLKETICSSGRPILKGIHRPGSKHKMSLVFLWKKGQII